MADYVIKANDTYPAIEAVLSDQLGAIDLTTADQVKLLLKSSAFVITGICDIVDAATGSVSYTWQVGDTANAGTYSGEFEITWATDIIETVPNDGYFSVDIVADLG